VELLSVLDDLEEYVQNSPRLPLTKKVLVDEEKMLDFLDRARTILPEEIRKAKWLVQERERVITDSRQEATRLLEEAQKEIERRVGESEIVKRAREVAEEIVAKAEQVSREMRLGARDYSDDVLAKLQNRLEKIMKEIEAGRKELKNMK
jgi:vacuolar-type H+-ATPase subunit H